MALTNHERVGKALDLLNRGLRPFVEREFGARYGGTWWTTASQTLQQTRDFQGRNGQVNLDTQALLLLMWNHWNDVFHSILGPSERSLVSELRGWRNKWAHQEAFSGDDGYRALDSAQRLLAAVSAPEAEEVERLKRELLRTRFEEQARQETRRRAGTPVEGQPAGNLVPWRQVITPHPDVASGRYQQAEFAADLNQVYRGEGSDEYRDPREFFTRTFITEGLRHLLINALKRLAGEGGDPVVELKTNFGGGKTHSMLALYHLVSGQPAGSLPGVEPLLRDAGVSQASRARRAVLVGQAISPAQPRRCAGEIEVRTLWGELAWQLLGTEGYRLVAEADRTGVNPGSDALQELFEAAGPCLVLIDEWVAYLRQLYHVSGLPAGSFDANLSFAQSLTEAARASAQTLVVASLPSSDIEIGGEGGKEALARLSNTFARVESTWRPASTEESFEIVRRRLFQPIEAQLFPARDAVVHTFSDLYRHQSQEFPPDSREADYERRMKAAYPIHPELFDRLYHDWSALDTFQRTRGVLRLMAATIHALWERQDAGVLILPASIPIDEPAVQFELTRYMEDPWVPVIETDVDGPNSLPLRLDRDNPNLGRYSAARRVARTIYMGSAPTLHAAKKGLDERQIKLGCVQPGESVATFGDALRRLTDRATHLYVDGTRYWYSTQPSVTRLAEDRAAQIDEDTVLEEIVKALRTQQSARFELARVHICPSSSIDVPDEGEARLVILRPEFSHASKTSDSPARREAEAILRERGGSPRLYQNTLVFLAADKTRLAELQQAVRQQMAWESILKDGETETLNLDKFQENQARTKCDQARQTVKKRIPETYNWLLVPTQPVPTGPIEWQEIRLQGDEALAVRAGRKLLGEELLITSLAPTYLRHYLDRIPLWRGESVGVKQLWEDFSRYLYLPRLKDQSVLLDAIRQGVASLTWESETFAKAEGWDEQRQRYLGLKAGEQVTVSPDGRSLLVKPDAARRQLDAEAAAVPGERPAAGARDTDRRPEELAPARIDGQREPTPAILTRFYGSVSLDPERVPRDAMQIADGILQQLNSLTGTTVRVTLEIEAERAEGFPDKVRSDVAENSRTLKFSSAEFEES